MNPSREDRHHKSERMAAEKKIGAKVYRFEPLLGWEAFDALDLLMDVMGPLAPVIEAAMQDDEANRTGMLARAIADAMKNRDRAAVRQLMGLLIGACRVDGTRCEVGVHPQTLNDMIEVAAFAGEAQFGSFFDGGAAKALGRLMPTAKA